jgi:hypothetical protein
MKRIGWLLFLALSAGAGQETVVSLPYRFTLSLGEGVACPGPVSCDVPGELPGEGITLCERQGEDWRPVPIQPDPVQPKRLWWLARQASAAYELRAGRTEFPATVTVEQGKEDLSLVLGQKPVLVYRHALLPPPAGASPRFARSGFIHPLYSPGGEVLTAIHPKDHLHHFGLWNPWTSTEFAGREVDFWNLGKGQGTVRFVRFESVFGGPVFAGFRAVHEHVALDQPGGERVVLEEVQDVRVWGTGDSRFLIDFASHQRSVAEQALTLKAYRYGGFVFRGRPGWNTGNSGYLTSEGRTRADGHGTRARWAHAYGDTPQGGAGVLFMSHPENHAHPEPLRLWPNDANGGKDNVFLNFCPVQKEAWVLEPGVPHVLRYRLCVYEGKPEGIPAEGLWQGFAMPPSVGVFELR